jgi:hypothetical protein
MVAGETSSYSPGDNCRRELEQEVKAALVRECRRPSSGGQNFSTKKFLAELLPAELFKGLDGKG